MPPSVQPTIANSYFTVDSTPDTRSSLVLLLQSALLVPALLVLALLVLALSSKMPTYYYLPLTIPISLLPSSPARSNIE